MPRVKFLDLLFDILDDFVNLTRETQEQEQVYRFNGWIQTVSERCFLVSCIGDNKGMNRTLFGNSPSRPHPASESDPFIDIGDGTQRREKVSFVLLAC